MKSVVQRSFNAYKKWADTWSKSQLVFLTIVVLILSSLAVVAAYELGKSQEVVRSLKQQ